MTSPQLSHEKTEVKELDNHWKTQYGGKKKKQNKRGDRLISQWTHPSAKKTTER